MRPAKKEKSDFSRQVIKLRTMRGLTQKQLAAELGVSLSTVSYYETEAANPGAELVVRLAEFFKVEPAVLIGGRRQRAPGPTSKLERQLNLIRGLPANEQRAVSTILDMALRNARHPAAGA